MAIHSFAYVYADAIVGGMRTYDSVKAIYKSDVRLVLRIYTEDGIITTAEYEMYVHEPYFA